MKTCISCGAQCDDSMNFCNKCGTPFAAPQVEETVEAVATTAVDMADEATVGVNDYMPPVAENVVETVEALQAPQEFANVSFAPQPEAPNKKSKLGLIIGIIAAVVVIVVVIVGFCTDWFGLAKKDSDKEKENTSGSEVKSETTEVDFSEMTEAIYNTFMADSFSFSLEGIEYDADGKKGMSQNFVNVKYAVDDDVVLIMSVMGFNEMMIANDTLYVYEAFGESQITPGGEETLDKFLEVRDKIKSGEMTEEDFAAILGNEELKEAFESPEYDDYYVSPEKAEEFANELKEKYFTNSEWIKKYLGYKKSGDTYIFVPDINKLCDELLRIVTESDAITQEAKDEFATEIDSIKTAMEEIKSVELSVKLKDGYLDVIEVVVEHKTEGKVVLKLDFTDINNTEITQDEIDEIVEKTEDAIVNSTCADCGEVMYDPEFHGDCKECGEHGELWDSGLCDSCEGIAV